MLFPNVSVRILFPSKNICVAAGVVLKRIFRSNKHNNTNEMDLSNGVSLVAFSHLFLFIFFIYRFFFYLSLEYRRVPNGFNGDTAHILV